MLIPKFWAEARAQHRGSERHLTVRRFGWSDEDEGAAQAMAASRAQEALARALAGENVLRFEPRRAYNGAEGVPIREEIVSRHGDTILTRNGYGARCLNTPSVLFVDIDHAERLPSLAPFEYIFPLLAAALAAWALSHRWFVVAAGIGALLVVHLVRSAGQRRRRRESKPGDAARARVAEFVAANPGWRFRLYETPAGLRALAMHRTFDPAEPDVLRSFAALEADPVYAKMCLNQRCFRARVSPKPWRIGITDHILPRSGAWPVAPEQQPARTKWVDRYEQAAQRHAACRYLETIGTAAEDPAVRAVQVLHDDLCRAATPLPTA